MPRPKNTIFINGVSVADRSTVNTQMIKGRGYRGFRIDATSAMGEMRDGPVANFCGRAILMLKDKAVLVIDRVEVPHAALAESRLHTFKAVTFRIDDATIKGNRERLHVSYASTEPTLLKEGEGMQTHPLTEGDTILRRVTTGKIFELTLCTLMVSKGRGSIRLSVRGKRTTIRVEGDVKAIVSFGTKGLIF